MANLDAVATADFVILSLSGAQEVDGWGENCLRSLASLGVGEGAVRGIVSVGLPLCIRFRQLANATFMLDQALPENAAATTQVRKSLHSFLRHFFPSLERLHAPAVPSEASNLLRSLGDRLPRGVIWRETRARVLAENVQWSEATSEEPVASTSTAEPLGTLAVTGVIRGSNLSANRLVHIQGFGDFQVEKVSVKRIVCNYRSNSRFRLYLLLPI